MEDGVISSIKQFKLILKYEMNLESFNRWEWSIELNFSVSNFQVYRDMIGNRDTANIAGKNRAEQINRSILELLLWNPEKNVNSLLLGYLLLLDMDDWMDQSMWLVEYFPCTWKHVVPAAM